MHGTLNIRNILVNKSLIKATKNTLINALKIMQEKIRY